jgi:hypothetical protein
MHMAIMIDCHDFPGLMPPQWAVKKLKKNFGDCSCFCNASQFNR